MGDLVDDRVGLKAPARGQGTNVRKATERELHVAQEALRLSDEQLRVITENVPAMIVYFDVNFVCRFSNSQYAQFFGLTRHEILGMSMLDVIGAANFDRLRPRLEAVLAGQALTYDRPQRLKSGELRHIRVAFVPDIDAAGEARGSYALVTDITEQKEAEQAIQTHALHQEAIAVYGQYALEDRDIERLISKAAACVSSGLQVAYSAVFRLSLGRDELVLAAGTGWDAGLIGRASVSMSEGGMAAKVLTANQSPATDADLTTSESTANFARSHGLSSTMEVIVPTSEGPFGLIAAFSKEPRSFSREDATFLKAIANALGTAIGRKRAEERLAYVAQFDSLTALPNRTLFLDRLSQAMSRARRRNTLMALIFLDLDRFKEINDTLGHKAGDRLLRLVAERLKRGVRAGDTVARLGGDEFTVILEDVKSIEEVTIVAQKLLQVLAKSFPLEAQEYFVTASAGITLYPLDHGNIDALIKNADIAMYHAKDRGRNNYQFYKPEMNALKQERMSLEIQLRKAMDRNELLVHYQPQVDLASERIVGVEALARWQHRELGLIMPDRFIPLAEHSGLIVQLGEWMLRRACAQAVAWQRAGLPPVRMAVNVSARQFRTELFKMVSGTLVETGLDPHWLELEVTEGLLMEEPEAASAVLSELKALGVNIAIDDFGAGYSSLTYLKHFPIDLLKIDRSFIRDLSTDPDDAAIAKAIIALAHSLDLKVVAEGVETPEQRAFLLQHGCDSVQGHYYSVPMKASELVPVLRRGSIPRA